MSKCDGKTPRERMLEIAKEFEGFDWNDPSLIEPRPIVRVKPGDAKRHFLECLSRQDDS
jgi:hypothetical protein